MKISIHEPGQLDSILERKKRLDFLLDFSELTAEENQSWLKKIEQNYFACGCNTGKKFMLYSLLLSAIYSFYIYYFKHEGLTLKVLASLLLFVFFMAGLGKFIGKSSAYNYLRKDISELKSILNYKNKMNRTRCTMEL